MKFKIILLLAFIAMLFACSEDSVLNDLTKSAEEDTLQSEMTQSDLKKGKAVTKTIKIRGTGIVTYDCLEYDENNDCIMYFAEVQGEGNATHLGKFTIELKYYADSNLFPLPNPIDPFNIPPITGVQTAANGDELNTYSVGPHPDDPENTLRFYYNGGSGRFENVIGYVVLTFDWSPDGLSYTNYGEGEITY